jgi:predicted nucleic acid-binding protein
MRVLFDTNVLLDALLVREPFVEQMLTRQMLTIVEQRSFIAAP